MRKAKCLWGGSSQDSREESKMPVGGAPRTVVRKAKKQNACGGGAPRTVVRKAKCLGGELPGQL